MEMLVNHQKKDIKLEDMILTKKLKKRDEVKDNNVNKKHEGQ